MIATKKTSPLTTRQLGILNFIADSLRNRQRPPTIREIADAFEISSTNGVVCHLQALEAKGYIERDRTCRGIRLLRVAVLPLIGRVSAGGLMEQFEFHEDWSFEDLFGDLDELTCLTLPDNRLLQYHLAEGDRIILRGRKPVGMYRRIEN